MRVSDETNSAIPNLAQSTQELSQVNGGLAMTQAVRARGLEFIDPAAPDPRRIVLYNTGNLQTTQANPSLDIYIDKMTKEEIREAMEKHLALCYVPE